MSVGYEEQTQVTVPEAARVDAIAGGKPITFTQSADGSRRLACDSKTGAVYGWGETDEQALEAAMLQLDRAQLQESAESGISTAVIANLETLAPMTDEQAVCGEVNHGHHAPDVFCTLAPKHSDPHSDGEHEWDDRTGPIRALRRLASAGAADQGSDLYTAAKAVVDYWEKGSYEPGIEARLTAAVRENVAQPRATTGGGPCPHTKASLRAAREENERLRAKLAAYEGGQEQGAVTDAQVNAFLRLVWEALPLSESDIRELDYPRKSHRASARIALQQIATLRAERDDAVKDVEAYKTVVEALRLSRNAAEADRDAKDALLHNTLKAGKTLGENCMRALQERDDARTARDAYRAALVELLTMPEFARVKRCERLVRAALSRDFTANSPAIADGASDDAGATSPLG